MRCGVCQTPAAPGSRFCASCGSPLTAPDEVTRLVEEAETVALDERPSAVVGPASRPLESSGAQPVVAPAPLGADPFTPGAVLNNRYRILRTVGQGGMGVVFLADDLRLGEPVALKRLSAALARDPRRLEQFHNEVSLARQVSHPNVCRVYDIGDADGHLFLTMEYVDGVDLATRLSQGPLGESEGVDLARQICAGLTAVHARGILHRDLKPANIMINRRGQPQIMDFGLADSGDGDRAREGTPAYMSPEQLSGGPATVRSDIYALGLILHEMFTGRRAVTARTLDELVAFHGSGGASKGALDGVAPALERTIRQCLDPDPARRPATVADVVLSLQTTLLDVTTRWRRILQNLILVPVAPMLMIGYGNVVSSATISGLVWLAGGLVMAVVGLRHSLRWTVPYKGHRIRFGNHALFGERLYIDDVLVDRGRVGRRSTLRGTIEKGEGAGERITARSNCGWIDFSCRIVAESFQ